MAAEVAGLRDRGWMLHHGLSAEGARAKVHALGHVILETHVVEGGKSDGHATVPLHTDHWRAGLVAWYCHAHAQSGGETLLVDAREAVSLLDDEDVRALRVIQVSGDGVRGPGAATMPLVRDGEGAPAVYYTPGGLGVTQRQHPGVLRFKAALGTLTPVRLSLARGDLLVVDNARMLHGRGALGEGSRRELTRWWIAP